MNVKKKKEQVKVRKMLPSAADIRTEIKRILTSPDFEASQRSKDFLRFVVEETLCGRSRTLKGYTIATQVFGRGKDFEPILDPIVRIEAGKLRRALERYYLMSGKHDPVRIEIPKGTNVPRFHEQAGIEADEPPESNRILEASFKDSWPSVLVRPFQNLTEDPDKSFFGVGLASDLATEISRFQEVEILFSSQEVQKRGVTDSAARYVIEGSFREDNQGIKLNVNLIDRIKNKYIWSDTHRSLYEAAGMTEFQEKCAQAIAAKVTGERGVIARALSSESKDKLPTKLTTYEAILRYYEFDQLHTPESFVRAKESLEHAVHIEPECGQVWSMLGRLYGNIYSLEHPGFETALENALEYTRKGIQLNPENQRCRVILAFVYMFKNEIDAALIEINQALAMNPNTLFMLDGIGYLLTLLGDWERGLELIKGTMERNPYYGHYVHYALWMDWIRREDYEQAYRETLNFNIPSLFWEPLIRASTFGQLGHYEQGKKAVEKLLALKPNFPERGRILIKHYIKFDEIAERVIEGLDKVGLEVT